ncbi:MAG: amidohydrolase family protein [Candidatus Latescibacteria bacterium]|jgi:hypothetical protein|nr:amidohydrolase family protein [Candidatus Latescibacterota bacterium]
MIVDSHTHMRAPIQGLEAGGRRNIYGVLDLGIEAYLKAFDEVGVDACWVFPLESFRTDSLALAEIEGLAAACRPYPHRLFPFVSVNPAWPEVSIRETVEHAVRDLQVHGLKFVPICQGVSLANPGMDVVAEVASRLNVPVFLHDGSPEYCSAIQVAYYARKYPDLRVVSGHGGLREYWPDHIDAVKELPNLYICLSGPTQWGIQTLYDELGPDRLMFGSDGGIGSPVITAAYLRRIDRLQAPEEDKRKILGTNAMRFLFGDDWEKALETRSAAQP